MADCIFCKIAAKEIPAAVVYEDQLVLAFKDLEPQAPFHALVIPKKHIESVGALTPEDKELAGHIMCEVIPAIVKENKLDKDVKDLKKADGKADKKADKKGTKKTAKKTVKK